MLLISILTKDYVLVCFLGQQAGFLELNKVTLNLAQNKQSKNKTNKQNLCDCVSSKWHLLIGQWGQIYIFSTSQSTI